MRNESNGMDRDRCAHLRAVGEFDQLLAQALTEVRAALDELHAMQEELADVKRDLAALKPSDFDE